MPGFVLATFGWWSVVTFVLDHILALGGVGLVAAIVGVVLLEIFVPGSVPLIRTAISAVTGAMQWLIGTTTGRVILLAVACFLAGFWTHSAFDRSAALEAKLAAQQRATKTAEAAAAHARLQAAMLDKVNADATRRAEAAEAEAADNAEQAADLADQLAAADKAAPAGPKRTCCALTAADIAALTRIGAPRK